MTKSRWDKDKLTSIVSKTLSYRQVLISLGLVVTNGNYCTLHKYLNLWDIDCGHFTHRRTDGRSWNTIDLTDILTSNSNYTNTNRLKLRLLAAGLIEERCESCGIDPLWNGKKLSLHLHHGGGNNRNNELSNLSLLCPNCHSQTKTFGGKNKGKSVLKSWLFNSTPWDQILEEYV